LLRIENVFKENHRFNGQKEVFILCVKIASQAQLTRNECVIFGVKVKIHLTELKVKILRISLIIDADLLRVSFEAVQV
jgi:hypothetical protein